jgi:hypothetical protein
MAVPQPKKALHRARQSWDAICGGQCPTEPSTEITLLPAESYGDLERRQLAHQPTYENRQYSHTLRDLPSVLGWELTAEGQHHLGTLLKSAARFA